MLLHAPILTDQADLMAGVNVMNIYEQNGFSKFFLEGDSAALVEFWGFLASSFYQAFSWVIEQDEDERIPARNDTKLLRHFAVQELNILEQSLVFLANQQRTKKSC